MSAAVDEVSDEVLSSVFTPKPDESGQMHDQRIKAFIFEQFPEVKEKCEKRVHPPQFRKALVSKEINEESIWKEVFTLREGESNEMHDERIKNFIQERLPEGADVLISVVREEDKFRVLVEPTSWFDYFVALLKQFFKTLFFGVASGIVEKYFPEEKLHEAADEMFSHGAKRIEIVVWKDGNKALKITGANGTDVTSYIAKIGNWILNFIVSKILQYLLGDILPKEALNNRLAD